MAIRRNGACAPGWIRVSLLAGAALGVVIPARADTAIDTWKVTQKIRVDGLLREWPGGFASFAQTLQGSAGGGEPKASGLVGYDDAHVYVAAKVFDDKVVRTAQMGGGEDHVTLTLAFPKASGWAAYELDLYPGDTGKSAAAAKVAGRVVKDAKVVEAPQEGGFVLEAQVPWSAFPESARIRAGLRAALRYTDADAPGRVKAVIATAKGAGSSAPPLHLEAERGLDAGLVRAQNLSRRPAKRAVGDLSGNGMLEVVAVYGKYLTIVGSHFRSGEQFYFGDLGVDDASGVLELDLADFDGDGKSEIFLRLRAGSKDEHRQLVRVMKVGDDDTPFTAFEHEVAVVTRQGRIENDVKRATSGGRPVLVISQGKAEGFEAGTYAEPLPASMASALLPWQTVQSRTFGWKGKGFEKLDEKQGEARATSAPSAAVSEGPPPPPAPRPPTADELLDRVYALYRKDRGVGKEKPRFDFVTDVTGDAQTERVLVHGKDIVVFGKGFLGGTSYVFVTAGVAEPSDIVDATARDLTGDGKAEIIVYGVRHTKTSKELGEVIVDRHVLFVYRVTDSAVGRIFSAETGRVLGDDKIIGTVKFRPAARGVSLELHPGRAIGWTRKTYPFPEDAQAAGGVEPLLLPWTSMPARRYEFDGSTYVLR